MSTTNLANRHMIYTEILAALISATLGMGAMFTKGLVWHALSRNPDFMGIPYRFWVGAPMAVFGSALIFICVIEWIHGRKWGDQELLVASRLREWFALLSCLSCFTLALDMVMHKSFWVAPVVTIHATILASTFAFCAYKSRRLCVVLDPRFSTERLRRELPNLW